jgi:hypothetical protein
MKPIDGNGQELDAIFTVQPADFGAYLIFESRGGGEGGPRPPRNADYAQALELLLGRLGQSGASLSEIEVHSRVALGLPIDQRRIAPKGYSLPIDLSALQDFERFRIELGKASAACGTRAKLRLRQSKFPSKRVPRELL